MVAKYDSTVQGLMMWGEDELAHVGRIASIEDKDIRYSYAQSTVNGMAHLKDAIFQYVNKYPQSHAKNDLLTLHAKVIRVMKHLVKQYKVDLNEIVAFNTHKVLTPLNYLKNNRKSNSKRKTRKN
jgi:hypothetical protein